MITANDVRIAATVCNHVKNRTFSDRIFILAPWKLYLGDSKIKTDNFERVISRSQPNKEGYKGFMTKIRLFRHFAWIIFVEGIWEFY